MPLFVFENYASIKPELARGAVVRGVRRTVRSNDDDDDDDEKVDRFILFYFVRSSALNRNTTTSRTLNCWCVSARERLRLLSRIVTFFRPQARTADALSDAELLDFTTLARVFGYPPTVEAQDCDGINDCSDSIDPN